MDNHPIPGFITRKQASDRCKRAERTLQRYWSRAMEHGDQSVLKHLKLRTEDGEIIEGTTVTKEGIEELKRDRKNPTWYVHAEWVEKTYGPRLENVPSVSTKPPSPIGATPPVREPAADGQVVTLLQEQIESLKKDKEDLREELRIKNEQIKAASERDRETHLLMRDLHGLMADLQKRLPAPAGSPSDDAVTVVDVAQSTPATEPVASSPAPKKKAATKRKGSRTRKKKTQRPTSIWHRDVSQLFPFRKK